MAENGQTIKYIFFSFDYDQENAEENGNTSSIDFVVKYQPNGEGGTRSPPAITHRLQHLTAYLIQNG